MQQTLLMIPHWLFEGPLLIAWLVVGVLILAGLFLKHGNSSETWSFLPVYGIVALIIHFILPQLEAPAINPEDPTGPMIAGGLAVRGYGLFLLVAIISGASLAIARCQRIGVTPDQIIQLGFWMMICGIVGARAFYVIQKPEVFFYNGVSSDALVNVINMTKGGLVVYGSLIGGSIAGLIFIWLNKMPLLKTMDIIAPGMVLGLAIGRIGCLMNGCCYGGVCEAPYPALQFPAGSPPYIQQLHQGTLLGIKGTKNTTSGDLAIFVNDVEPDSLAARLGIQKNDELTIHSPAADCLRFQKENPDNELAATVPIYIESNRGSYQLPLRELPARSLRTHPTQVYSSINALLLCLVLWFYWTLPHRHGEVFALMLIFYSVARFLIEMVRRDEQGLFGTELTISQWVSMGTIVIGFALFAYARGRRADDTNADVAAT